MSDPSKKSLDIGELHQKLILPHALMEGTIGMRAAAESFLPKEEAEQQKDYESRLARSFLFGGFERTLAILTGEVFDKPVTISEETPDEFEVLTDNIDQQGRNMTRFTREFFSHALFNGVGFILVETPLLPKDEEDNPTPTTAADDQKMGRRLYWVHIPASQCVGARVENINGAAIITQFRISENIKEPDGDYNETDVEQIRVLERGTWEVFRKSKGGGDKNAWVRYDGGETGLDFIPLVPYHTGSHDGLFDVKPPLNGLAELNQAHWISSSDQNSILHVARVPIMFGKGLAKDADTGAVIVSARNLIHSDDVDADLKFVEHSGKAIGDGWKDLERLEMMMSLWGLELISDTRSGNVTATENVINTAKTGSFLNSVALDCQDALNTAIEISCDILGVEFDGGATINTDFSLALQNFDNMTLIQAFKDGLLDRITVIDELKRRGAISENVDPADVIAGLDNDARSGSFGNIGASLLPGT